MFRIQCVKMHFSRGILLCSTLILLVKSGIAVTNITAGYVPGLSGMTNINSSDCALDASLANKNLSTALECARTCVSGAAAKTCYYKFEVERYPVNGQACQYCTPNFTNNICPNCQCVLGNGVQRMALTVNRMIPGPSIQVCLGDTIVVDLVNRIKEDAVTIHWHGIFQKDFQYYDGVPYVTQCPVLSSNSFRYKYVAKNSGTHFWHAHTGVQKMDGIFGSLIVREPADQEPNAALYDNDLANHVIVINDWMSEEATERVPGRNSGVVGQLPDAVLINGKGQFQSVKNSTIIDVITVDADQTYRFRLINSFCGICPAELTIEGHNLTAIAVDGQPIQPVAINTIVSFPGERYDFILNANQTPGTYWIQLRAIGDCAASSIHSIGALQYSNVSSTVGTKQRPDYSPGLPLGIVLNAVESGCNNTNATQICINSLRSAVTVDADILNTTADVQIFLPIGLNVFTPQDIFKANTYKDFLVVASNVTASTTVDGISFAAPPSPPISQMKDMDSSQFCSSSNLPSGCNSNNTCVCTHMIDIPLNSVVEIGLVDNFNVPNVEHPFHLHGYAFHVLAMGQPFGPSTGNFSATPTNYLAQLDKNNQIQRNFDNPPGKDTIAVPNNGYVIFRFHATNPGYWFFHCHFVFHQEVGMALILKVGNQCDLPRVPKGFPKCGNFLPSL